MARDDIVGARREVDQEARRLAALKETRVLDTAPEDRFDRITQMAALHFQAPIVLVSLIDEDRQWFKSCIGLTVGETPRGWAFCDHAIRGGPSSVLVIEDAAADPRFAANPLVLGEPLIRFYAGAVLTTAAGHNLGTLCVIDKKPRSRPSEGELDHLRTLAALVVDQVELSRATKELQEGSRLLGLAEAMSGVGHWRYDVVSGEVHWSNEVFRIHGITPARQAPDYAQVQALYHEDDRATLASQVQRAVASGEGYDLSLRIRRPDGIIRNVSAKAECELDGAGRTTALFGVFQDVTDEVQRLEAVKRSERRYRLLADNVGDVITRVRADGSSGYISPAVKMLLGFEPEEMSGGSAQDFVHPDDRPNVTRTFMEVAETRTDRTLRHRAVHKDGRVIWVESRFRPITGPKGFTNEFTVAIRDITDRKRAEDLLVESEGRYRLLAENATDIITVFSPDGIMRYVSPACRKLGWEPEELIGRSTLSLVHPHDAEHATNILRGLFTGQPVDSTLRREYRLRCKDGSYVWLEGNPTIILGDDGAPLEVVSVFRNVTTRREMEEALGRAKAEAEAATAVKAEFLANMSHELRTPLTSIIGFSELLEKSDLADAERRYVQLLGEASRALVTTVNDILDFSKLEAGQVEIERRPIDPTALAHAVMEMLGPVAEKKGLGRRVEAEALPRRVMADDARLRQILLNFIGNAVKFTARGEVVLSARYDAPRSRLRFDVADTGPGIPANEIGKLFKRFSQVDASTTRAFGGTGLGLAICRGLAEAMGGEVGVDSSAGRGSRFWVEVPCEPEPSAVAASAPLDVVSLSDALAGTRVLVVDDHHINCELTRVITAGFGVVLTEASSGAEAVDVARRTPFDVILMDIRMPEIDGPTAARIIREGDGPNRAIPIIAFTAEVAAGDMPVDWRGLFDDRLAKPIIAADVLTMIARWSSFETEGAE